MNARGALVEIAVDVDARDRRVGGEGGGGDAADAPVVEAGAQIATVRAVGYRLS